MGIIIIMPKSMLESRTPHWESGWQLLQCCPSPHAHHYSVIPETPHRSTFGSAARQALCSQAASVGPDSKWPREACTAAQHGARSITISRPLRRTAVGRTCCASPGPGASGRTAGAAARPCGCQTLRKHSTGAPPKHSTGVGGVHKLGETWKDWIATGRTRIPPSSPRQRHTHFGGCHVRQ